MEFPLSSSRVVTLARRNSSISDIFGSIGSALFSFLEGSSHTPVDGSHTGSVIAAGRMFGR